MNSFIISPVKEKKSPNSPDYNIITKDAEGGIVYLGSAWKKTGQFGVYLSCQLKNPEVYNNTERDGYDIIVKKLHPTEPQYTLADVYPEGEPLNFDTL